MAKLYKFNKKDMNRYRKVYRYIRKKPMNSYCSDVGFELIAGSIDFTNSDSETFIYPVNTTFTNVPVITVASVDSEANDQADVNVYVSAVSNSQVTLESSSPFIGKVHFVIVSQD
jgi:hypothetical protein